MKLSRFIIVKLTFLLILGIYLGNYCHVPLVTCASITTGLLLALGSIFFLDKNKFTKSNWFGITAYLLILFIGIVTVNIHDDRLQPSHYTNNNYANQTTTFQVRDVLKSSAYYNKYTAQILKINNTPASGKIILNIKKDSTETPLNVDDVFVSTENLSEIPPPLNPGQFNYQAFLNRKNIYAQLISSPTQLLKLKTKRHTIFGIADYIKSHFINSLQTYNFGTDELSILKALLLGQREDLSSELYNNYTKAGTIHILAVSGLHVGILLLLLNFLLKPLESLKGGHFMKTTIIIMLLWSFAVITGLSASVCRAVTMFSLLAISLNQNRPGNTYNIIAISAFILLLIQPNFLFDVGFQLSYLAVLSIVSFQPKIYTLWIPKYQLSDFLWKTMSVTLAAQLGVVPLSIYYFHQFPGLFLLSNLIVVPLVALVIPIGISVLTLSVFSIPIHILADILNLILKFINDFIIWIANQDAFLFKNISLPLNIVLTVYLLILCILNFIRHRTYQSIVFIFIAVISIQIFLIYNVKSSNNTDWWILHKNRNTLLAHQNYNTLNLYHNIPEEVNIEDYSINNLKMKYSIDSVALNPLQSVYAINSKPLLVIDSTGIYPNAPIETHYLLLTGSPRINLNRMLSTLKPKIVIADGSNFTTFVNRWSETCRHKKIPFHHTGKKGAYHFYE